MFVANGKGGIQRFTNMTLYELKLREQFDPGSGRVLLACVMHTIVWTEGAFERSRLWSQVN